MSLLSDIGKAGLIARSGASLVDRFSPKKASTGNNDFSTDAFLSKITQNKGVLSNNRFLFTLHFPLTTKVDKKFLKLNDERVIQFMCSSTSLPGMSFTTTEIRRFGVGPLTFYPSNVTYPELPLNFIVDGNANMINFLYGWFSTVVNMGMSAGEKTANKNTAAYPYEMTYKDEYKAQGTITVFNTTNQKVIEYKLNDVIPSSIADTALEWGAEGVMNIGATFRFDSFTIEGHDLSVPVTKSRGLSIFETIYKTAAIGESVIGALKTPTSIGDVLNLAANAQLVKQNFNFIK